MIKRVFFKFIEISVDFGGQNSVQIELEFRLDKVICICSRNQTNSFREDIERVSFFFSLKTKRPTYAVRRVVCILAERERERERLASSFRIDEIEVINDTCVISMRINARVEQLDRRIAPLFAWSVYTTES